MTNLVEVQYAQAISVATQYRSCALNTKHYFNPPLTIIIISNSTDIVG